MVGIMLSSQLLDKTIAAIRTAGYRPDQWQTAIDLLAEATGSRMGELIGWRGVDRQPFRMITKERMDNAAMLSVWDEIGGHRPNVNPMIARGVRAPLLDTILDTDVADRDARRHLALWNEVFDPYDIPHLGSVVLERVGSSHFVIGVLRSRAQGPLAGEARLVFDRCASEAAESAAFMRSFGDESGKLVTSALDALKVAAIAINGFGIVVGITPAAEKLVATGRCLRVPYRRLECVDEGQKEDFAKLLDAGLIDGRPGQLTLRGEGQMLRLSLHRLNGELDLGYNAKVILVLEDISEQLTLTKSEAEILALLRQGLRVSSIAQRRGVSTSTVRSQTKAIYAKLGAAGQFQLLTRTPDG